MAKVRFQTGWIGLSTCALALYAGARFAQGRKVLPLHHLITQIINIIYLYISGERAHGYRVIKY
jgi:hypothetical protein